MVNAGLIDTDQIFACRCFYSEQRDSTSELSMYLNRKSAQIFCRLLLVVWVFTFATGSLAGCPADPDHSQGHLATAVLTSMAGAGHGHDVVVELCEKYCQNISASLGKADQSHSAQLPGVFTLLLWIGWPFLLLSRFFDCRSVRGLRFVSPAVPYPPFLLFQRFNN